MFIYIHYSYLEVEVFKLFSLALMLYIYIYIYIYIQYVSIKIFYERINMYFYDLFLREISSIDLNVIQIKPKDIYINHTHTHIYIYISHFDLQVISIKLKDMCVCIYVYTYVYVCMFCPVRCLVIVYFIITRLMFVNTLFVFFCFSYLFCILCISLPFYCSVYYFSFCAVCSLFLHKFTDHCHRVENQLQ